MNAYVYQAALICEDCARKVQGQLLVGTCESILDSPGRPAGRHIGAGIYCHTSPCRHGIRPSVYRQMCQDSDCWPQGPYANGGGESDSPQHCDQCGLALDNPLTEDGQLAKAASSPAYFDRFDICEAHYVYAHDIGDYARRTKLDRMQFHARPSLASWQHLNENAQAIYARLVTRA